MHPAPSFANGDKRIARRKRVAFVNTHPIQYAAPLYAYLNGSSEIEPVALYLSDFSLRGDVDRQFGRKVVWDIDLLAGYEHHFVGRHWRTAQPYSFASLKGDGLWRAIGEGGFDALVVHGHGYMSDLVALAAARFRRIPVFYKAETHLLLPRDRARATLRPLALKSLFSQMQGFLAVSSRNRDFYRSLGVSDERIFHFPYTVDNDRFAASAAVGAERRADVREQLGLSDDRPVVVYASKFMRRKHPDHLIRAAQALAREGLDLQLLMIGTGEMEAELKVLAEQEPRLPVRFAGFKNQSELPAILGACDVFVLPSENEPFGLIVNEAMCAGLPIIASDEIGCVPDLVISGRNGATFKSGDVAGLVAALRPLIEDPQLRVAMAKASRDIISRWSYRENLSGLKAALSLKA